MAKLTPEAQSEKMKAYWAEKKAQKQDSDSEQITAEPQKEPAQQDLNKLLKRLEEQEKRLQELEKGESNIFKDAKEKYKWPRNYKFTMWWWVPVLSYESFRKDPTKDFVYKNQYGTYESNHYLKLTLANGKTEEVEVNIFNRDKSKTDPMPCKIQTNEDWEQVYIFSTEDYGQITVLSKIIN